MSHLTVLWTVVLISVAAAHGQTPVNIFQVTLGESGQRTAEVSTEQLRGILADKSAVVLDTRPFREFAISHIPGAVNVAAKPGVPMSAYVSDVAEIGRLLEGKKETPLVLYCNGAYCGKSKRLAEELLALEVAGDADDVHRGRRRGHTRRRFPSRGGSACRPRIYRGPRGTEKWLPLFGGDCRVRAAGAAASRW